MTLWILSAGLALAGLAALAAAVRLRRRRAHRLQLRVLAGRRRLLGEEIGQRCQRLDQLDPTELGACRKAARGALDQLHVRLLDREAHLQNLDELARLQRHKLCVLARRYHELAATPASPDAVPATEDGPDDDAPVLERRERLQDRLLERIQERGQDLPSRPPRRRRRRR